MAYFVAIALLILALVHLAIYKMVVSVFAVIAVSQLMTLRIVIVFLGLSFLTATLISSKFENVFTRAFYQFSAYWVGIMVFLFLASILYGIVVGGVALFDGNMVWAILFGKVLIAVVAVTCIYGAYHANDSVVTRYEVILPHLPTEWKGKKAVLVADLHFGQVRGEKFATKVATMVNAESPDVVLISGDMYDGVEVDEVKVAAPLSAIKAPWGMYFAPGNHEEIHGAPQNYFGAIEKAGIKVLDDQKVDVHGVDIVGVDYKTTEHADGFKKVLASLNLDKEKTSILIKHVPDNIDIAEEAGVDMQVSGHTHKAQIWPLSLITKRLFKDYDYGLKAWGSLEQVTTSGIGTWGPPYRVGTKSEIVVITFL